VALYALHVGVAPHITPPVWCRTRAR
jgi:hypothetical protein